MAYVDLDKIINVTWGGSWTIYPDVPYPVLNQRIGIFNAPNARDTDSNGRFGLLGSSNAGICQQNYNFNQQIALAVDSWVGALSTRVKSYDFSVAIDKVDGGAIKYWVFTDFPEISSPYSLIDFDYSTKVLSDNISLSNWMWSWGWNNCKKWYIATSDWWNKFLVTNNSAWNVLVYPMDSNNVITSSTPTTTATLRSRPSYVASVVWEYVWIFSIGFQDGLHPDPWHKCFWALYKIDDLWLLTIQWTEQEIVVFWWITWGFYWNWTAFSSYTKNNTAYLVAGNVAAWASTSWSWSIFLSVDLTTLTDFVYTTIFSINGTDYLPTTARIQYGYTPLYVNWWYSTTDDKYYFSNWTNIVSVDSSWFVNTWVGTAFINHTYTQRYNNTLSKLTTASENIYIDNNSILNVLGSAINWTVSYLNTMFLFNFTWTNEEDDNDALVGMYVKTTAQTVDLDDEDLWITCTINWTSIPVTAFDIFTWQTGNELWVSIPTQDNFHTINIQQFLVWAPYIDIVLQTANVNSRNLKLWIGITGWTYASPTLPSNNGMSGNQTTARTAGSDASYIDLTLSTNSNAPWKKHLNYETLFPTVNMR